LITDEDDGEDTNVTSNVVYEEVFCNVMKLHTNVLKISYFFYRIIDRITKFSFIIFQISYILWSVLFCLLWIITCYFFTVTSYILHFIIRNFVCQSLYNKPVQSTGQKFSIYYCGVNIVYWRRWCIMLQNFLLQKKKSFKIS